MRERIEINPRICGGKPVIHGTQIPMTVILPELAEGLPCEAVIKKLPELEREDVFAALEFAVGKPG